MLSNTRPGNVRFRTKAVAAAPGEVSGGRAHSAVFDSYQFMAVLLVLKTTMRVLSRIVISSAIVLMAASAASSKDGGVPKIDIQKQCLKTQNAIDELTGQKNPDAFDLCVKTEQSAREKLVERWPTIPTLDKTNCIHPTDWSPSYFEWLGCLDTRVYARDLRKQHPTDMPASGLCPTVNWQSDGSITGIVACQLR